MIDLKSQRRWTFITPSPLSDTLFLISLVVIIPSTRSYFDNNHPFNRVVRMYIPLSPISPSTSPMGRCDLVV